MVYRHLRQMDEEGLVISSWDNEGDGPAKRIYSITPEGMEMLEMWIHHNGTAAGQAGRFYCALPEAVAVVFPGCFFCPLCFPFLAWAGVQTPCSTFFTCNTGLPSQREGRIQAASMTVSPGRGTRGVAVH